MNKKHIVHRLLKIDRIEQKSEKWYEMRMNMITASDFAQALGEGKFGTQKQLIQKKCTPRENESALSKSNPFFKWGNMFEPVAIAIYSRMFKAEVHEFGLLPHPKYPFFGASPDGITEDGVMVEIKCPFKRKLNGEVPRQYFYQIQGQLDVCDLDDCDYFECSFEILDSFDSFCKEHDKVRGVFRENGDTYEYKQPYFPNDNANDIWNDEKCKYWVLKEYNLVRVKRDPAFISEKMNLLSDVWNKILHYRQNPNDFDRDIGYSISVSTEPFEKKVRKTFIPQNYDTYMFLD